MATKRNGSRTSARTTGRSASRGGARGGRTGAVRKHAVRSSSGTRGSGSRRRASGSKRRKPVSVGYLFWTALMLLVLVIFLFNRIAIRDVVERTELVDVLQRSMEDAVGREQPVPLPPVRTVPAERPAPRDVPAAAAPAPRAASEIERPDIAPPERPPAATDAAPEPAPEAAAPPPPTATPAANQRHDPSPAPIRQEPPAAAAKPPASEDAAAARPARQHRLFFAEVDSSGGISLTGVARAAETSAAPLTEALVTLLAGPDPTESKRGLITLIPPAVTLNTVYIRERIAYVDVSESFRFNRFGREGLDIQLQQVVYSATQFTNVEQVQILIDGRRIDYLASEGTFVGKPIGREAFQ